MDLQELRFVVKTEQLDEAAKKIQALGTAVADLESKQKSASQSGKEDAKALKAKLKLESDLVILKAKLAKAEEDAANKANGTTESNKKQAAESSKLASMLERLNSVYGLMSNGSTKAESSILHLAKTLGASEEQFQQVKKSLEQIASLSKNPFDSSISAARSINGELQSMKDRAKLAADGISLTTKQLQEYSRIGSEIRGKMQSAGIDPSSTEGVSFFNAELKKQQSEYASIAKEVNNLKNVEAQRIAALASQKKAAEDLFVNYQTKQKDTAKYYQEDMQKLKEHYSALEALDKNNVAAQQKSSDALFRNKIIKQKDDEKAYRSAMQDLKNMYAEQEREALSAEKYLNQINQRIARDAAASRYIEKGSSVATANYAAGMEVRGVDKSIINTFVQSANAKEQDAKASRELAAAHKYITETEQKLAAAVENANQNLNRQATDELTKYQRALQTVGTSAEETTRKLKVFKEQQAVAVSKEREQQLSHLSRSISTQMGDVGISLASGMNPLTVMLQQGDQIRFALQQAGAEGKELQQAMNGAASQIASSVALTFKAMGGFVKGIVTTSIDSVKQAATGSVQFYKDFMTVQAEMASSSITMAEKNVLMKQSADMLVGSFATLGKVILGTAAVITGVLLIAYAQVIKQEQALSKALVENGAALGYSKESAMSFAESLKGITTGTAISAITEFANAGVKGTESTERMMLAAVDLEKYGGKAVADTAKEYAKLQGEPMKALQDLAESSGRVTVATLEKAKAYKEAGDKANLLSLAETEAARVTEEKAQAMKSSMSPIQELWIDIKHAVGGAWEEIQNLTKAGPIVTALRLVFETVAVMATEVYFAIKGIRGALAALPAMAGAILADIKNLDTGATETKRMIGVINQAGEENKVAYDKAIASILGTGKAVQSAGAISSKQLQTNTELAKSFGKASEAEEKYLSNINKMKRDRNELEAEYNKATKQGKAGEPSANLFKNAMSNLDEKIKEAELAKAKKDRGPKPATSSFGGVASSVSLVDNTSNIQREYSSELSKTQKFIKSQRDILKLSFEAGLVSRGEYIAKDVDLITRGQSSELNVIAAYGEKIKSEHDRVSEAIEARRKDALAATKDPESITRINREATDQLTKLNEAQKTFNELQADKKEVISFEADKRYYESLKEQNAAMLESKKHLEDLNKTMQDAAEIRALEAQSQWDTMYIAGDELASYKARNEALKDYVKLQSKLKADLANAEKLHADYTSNTTFDGQNQEGIEKAVQMYRQVQLIRDQLTKAGIDAETAARIAGIDAVNKYYMDKAMEVRDGTAAAITEGIMNGGKAGSDAIKNVLNNVLRDMLNNVFKSMLGSIGNEITKAITSGGQQQSSGGGFLQSIVGFGLNALAGSFGGGASASGSSTYSLGSGTDMTSGLKFRATGGFVNQGSEYMVGENGPEKFIPKQSGTIVPNHKLAKNSASSDPMKVTIINNTSSPIGKVTERQISPTERALVIEEAVQAVASAMHDPNHKVSKSLGQNYKMQRNR